jgi:hypothetical protein
MLQKRYFSFNGLYQVETDKITLLSNSMSETRKERNNNIPAIMFPK